MEDNVEYHFQILIPCVSTIRSVPLWPTVQLVLCEVLIFKMSG